MDSKLKDKWIKALRSGKFRQARGRLTKGKNHHCCIGVAAVVANPKIKLGVSTGDAAALVGINSSEQQVLVDMNDHERRSFKTIADYIEKNL